MTGLAKYLTLYHSIKLNGSYDLFWPSYPKNQGKGAFDQTNQFKNQIGSIQENIRQ